MSTSGQLDDIVQQIWQWRLQDSPEFATTVGVHTFDDRLESFTTQALEKRFTQCRTWLGDLDKLDKVTLSKSEKRTYELLYSQLHTMVDGYKWRYHGAYNAVNFLENIPVDFVSYIISSMQFKCESDFSKYISRLQAIPTLVEEQTLLLRESLAKEITLHEVSLTGAIKELEKNAQCPPEDTVFYKPYTALDETIDIPKNLFPALKEEATRKIKDDVQPALGKLARFLQSEYLPKCRSNYGVGSLPDGEDYYQDCLRWHLSVDLSPKEVYELGLEEVARIRQGMEEVKREVGFQGDLEAFLAHMRTAPEFYHDTKEALLSEYDQIIHGHIKPLLSKAFNRDPGIDLEVKAMPFSGPGGMYYPPAPDGSRPGVFYANLEHPETRPRFSMVVLSLHEASPGHHFQISFALQEQLPRFRKEIDFRKVYGAPFMFPMYTAYIEGWALYCEYLGLELGAYRTPYDLFGRYSDEILRACRLVVDPGLHVFGWSRDKAVKYMQNNTCLPLDEIEEEVDRYVTWPGQACAYKVGEIKIRELRKSAEKELGERFDLKAFHDILLKIGPVPLSMLEQAVNEWIAEIQR